MQLRRNMMLMTCVLKLISRKRIMELQWTVKLVMDFDHCTYTFLLEINYSCGEQFVLKTFQIMV